MHSNSSGALKSSLLLMAFCLRVPLTAGDFSADVTSVLSIIPQDQEEPTEAATDVTTEPAASRAECALLCTLAGQLRCGACVFKGDDGGGICAMAPSRKADLNASGAEVLRRKKNWDWFYDFYQQVDGRNFQVIQQRFKGSLSFARGWAEYEIGFGDDTDFWIGLYQLHKLTGNTPKLLRVDAVTWSNVAYACEYSGFSVAGAGTNYTMTYEQRLSSSSSISLDSMLVNNGRQFSTIDRDNDLWDNHCSHPNIGGGAGWWFSACTFANPNGLYATSAVVDQDKMMFWYGVEGNRAALKSIRLMLQV